MTNTNDTTPDQPRRDDQPEVPEPGTPVSVPDDAGNTDDGENTDDADHERIERESTERIARDND